MYGDDYIKQVLGDDYDNNVLKKLDSEPNYENNVYPKEMYKQAHDIINDDKKNADENEIRNNVKKEKKEVEEAKIEEIGNKENKENKNETKSILTKTRSELEGFYPEIYKMIIPMIENLVGRNEHMTFTQEVIETMVSEIYDYVEEDIISNKENNTTINNDKEAILVHVNPYRRKPKNTLLYDLIKILLLNRLCII